MAAAEAAVAHSASEQSDGSETALSSPSVMTTVVPTGLPGLSPRLWRRFCGRRTGANFIMPYFPEACTRFLHQAAPCEPNGLAACCAGARKNRAEEFRCSAHPLPSALFVGVLQPSHPVKPSSGRHAAALAAGRPGKGVVRALPIRAA